MPRTPYISGSLNEPVVGCSRAVKVGNTLSISACAPLAADGKATDTGNSYGQVVRCLEVISNVIAEAGFSTGDVVKTRVYFKDHHQWKDIARAHGEVFGAICPARAFILTVGFANPE